MERLFALALLILASAPAAHAVEPDQLDGMQARFIGGSIPGGRALALAADQANPDTLYVGGATSGVWKTVNGGITWKPLFDEQDTSSIGTITVYQPDPGIVWVGTGEGKPRYGTGVGTGVFKSTDAGETWQKMGLADSERIQRIHIHPEDPDIVWVAAVGPAYQDGEERGVFKTTDGGASWRRVLFTNPGSGAADLALDPSDPDRLLAAMWEFRRKPWDFNSGGPGSGLFLSEAAARAGRNSGLPTDSRKANSAVSVWPSIRPTRCVSGPRSKRKTVRSTVQTMADAAGACSMTTGRSLAITRDRGTARS